MSGMHCLDLCEGRMQGPRFGPALVWCIVTWWQGRSNNNHHEPPLWTIYYPVLTENQPSLNHLLSIYHEFTTGLPPSSHSQARSLALERYRISGGREHRGPLHWCLQGARRVGAKIHLDPVMVYDGLWLMAVGWEGSKEPRVTRYPFKGVAKELIPPEKLLFFCSRLVETLWHWYYFFLLELWNNNWLVDRWLMVMSFQYSR